MILSDIFFSASGKQFLLLRNFLRQDIATNRLGRPCPCWCWMASCIRLRLSGPLLLRISRSIVCKPVTDTLKRLMSKYQQHNFRLRTFSKSVGSAALSAAMARISLATLVMSLDRDLPLPRSVVFKYSSQLSNSVCLNDCWTQRLYGPMLMYWMQVKVNKVPSPTGRTFIYPRFATSIQPLNNSQSTVLYISPFKY